jgi:hypothetical protein
MIVYKYLAPERIDVLENSRIRFTQIALLNDPFETLPYFGHLKKYLLNQDPEVADVQLLATSSLLNRMFVILSLSKVRNNLLMWAHYTNSHKGFVVGFDSSSPFFKPGNGKGVDGLKEVKYSKKRNRVPAEDDKSFDDPTLPILGRSITFIKSSAWRYEKEMRILAYTLSADANSKDSDGNLIYLFDFPPNSVKQIIIGHNASPLLRERIVSLKIQQYPNAKLFREVLDNSQFELKIEPFVG